MDTSSVFSEFISRARDALARLDGFTVEEANASPGGHPNSLVWLLWHSGRQMDAQLAALSGGQQRWKGSSISERAGLGELGDGIGYGQSTEDARRAEVHTPDQLASLREYVSDCLDDVERYVASGVDLDEVIDRSFDPPVTRGSRLVSLIDDTISHLGQAAYAATIVAA